MEELLTVKEVAEKLKVTEQTIQRYIMQKEIPFKKIKRMVRFRASEIEKWIDDGGFESNGVGGLFDESENS